MVVVAGIKDSTMKSVQLQVKMYTALRSLEEGMATLSSTLAWRIPTDRGVWRDTVHGVAKSQT